MVRSKPSNRSNNRHHVWVVEDNAEFGAELARLLNATTQFYCDKCFASCEPALAMLREGVLPDLVLMDIGLPGLNGIDGIRQAKLISPSVKFVVLTVFEDTDNIVRAIAAGASGYLHKGAPIGETIASLSSILAGGAPMSPQIARKMLELFAGASTPASDYSLTSREREILKFLVDGLTKKEIADRLFLSFHTIDNHFRNIYAKLHVQSRSGAVSKALKERLL